MAWKLMSFGCKKCGATYEVLGKYTESGVSWDKEDGVCPTCGDADPENQGPVISNPSVYYRHQTWGTL